MPIIERNAVNSIRPTKTPQVSPQSWIIEHAELDRKRTRPTITVLRVGKCFEAKRVTCGTGSARSLGGQELGSEHDRGHATIVLGTEKHALGSNISVRFHGKCEKVSATVRLLSSEAKRVLKVLTHSCTFVSSIYTCESIIPPPSVRG